MKISLLESVVEEGELGVGLPDLAQGRLVQLVVESLVLQADFNTPVNIIAPLCRKDTQANPKFH